MQALQTELQGQQSNNTVLALKEKQLELSSTKERERSQNMLLIMRKELAALKQRAGHLTDMQREQNATKSESWPGYSARL